MISLNPASEMFSIWSMLDYSFRMTHDRGRWRLKHRIVHTIYYLLVIYLIEKALCAALCLYRKQTLNQYKYTDPVSYYVNEIVLSSRMSCILSLLPLHIFDIYLAVLMTGIFNHFRPRHDDLYYFTAPLLYLNLAESLRLDVSHFWFEYDPYIDEQYKTKLMRACVYSGLVSKIISTLFSTFFVLTNACLMGLMVLSHDYTIPVRVMTIFDSMIYSFNTLYSVYLAIALCLQMIVLFVAKTLPFRIERRKLSRICWNPNRQADRLHRMFVFALNEAVKSNRKSFSPIFTVCVLMNLPFNVTAIATVIQGGMNSNIGYVYIYVIVVPQTMLLTIMAFMFVFAAKSIIYARPWMLSNIGRIVRQSDRRTGYRRANFCEILNHRRPFRYTFFLFGGVSTKSIVTVMLTYSAAIMASFK